MSRAFKHLLGLPMNAGVNSALRLTRGWTGLVNCGDDENTVTLSFSKVPTSADFKAGMVISAGGNNFNYDGNSPVKTGKLVAYTGAWDNPLIPSSIPQAVYTKLNGDYVLVDSSGSDTFLDDFEGSVAGTEISAHNSAWTTNSRIVVASNGTEITGQNGNFQLSNIDVGASEFTINFDYRNITPNGTSNRFDVLLRIQNSGSSANAVYAHIDTATNGDVTIRFRTRKNNGLSGVGVTVPVDAPVQTGLMNFTIVDDASGITFTSNNNGESVSITNQQIIDAIAGAGDPQDLPASNFAGFTTGNKESQNFMDNFQVDYGAVVTTPMEDQTKLLTNCGALNGMIYSPLLGASDNKVALPNVGAGGQEYNVDLSLMNSVNIQLMILPSANTVTWTATAAFSNDGDASNSHSSTLLTPVTSASGNQILSLPKTDAYAHITIDGSVAGEDIWSYVLGDKA